MTRTVLLGDVAMLVVDKISVENVLLNDYVSTENLLPDKAGISPAVKLPNIGKVTYYKKGDVLVSNIRPYFKKIWHADREGGSSNDILVFRPKTSNVRNDYLYYVLKNDQFFNFSTNSSSGSKMPRGDKTQIMKYPIYLPNLETQQKIADILGSLDEKIELNRKMNETLKQIGQALFRHYFIDNPEADAVKIGELINKITTRVGRDSGDKYVVLSAVKTGELVASEEYFTKQVFSRDISKYKIVHLHEFAYNPARVNIGSIGMLTRNISGAVSPVYEAFGAMFGYHDAINELLKLPRTKKRIADLCSGTVRQILRFEDFCRIDAYKIPEASLNEFNTQYEEIQRMIGHIKEQNQTLATLRDTLLPRLIDGTLKI